jgi:RecA/RadA recombinase
LLKNSTIKDAADLSHSRLFEEKDIIVLDCPALNIALSGDAIEGGLVPGIVQIAAESKHFKSKFALEIAKSFLKKFPEGVIILYDSEFGTPESYFEGLNINNIIHCPILDLEEFKHDIVVQLKEITREDKVLIIVDSLGNMPSIKELEDAEKGNSSQDMTRAKQMKSIFRMVMPRINQKNVYCVMVNHTYKTLEMFSKDVPTGGTGSIYNSNIIWTISKAKEKESVTSEVDGKKKTKEELVGYQFTINIYKSRFVKEESKIPIVVTFEGGIDRWSGLLELAEKAEVIIRPTKQSYARADKPEITYKAKEIEDNDEFWLALFKETKFNQWIKEEYQL